MTIDEAISILENMIWAEDYEKDSVETKAIQLSVEALKRIKKRNTITHTELSSLLPGETEEVK